ncbi:DNA-repair protein XRCC1 isoform X1 [Telopea speciosissima]|uniref:DNA-repair protein XRCC1 isoform X1 n=1 Tax=Telopea speciosissima TaxID=54955 RepID=UPI001CC721C7|nr:DNA-repair protein XRCC1 isoform X1 [Telopea speciosissima]XP_043700513.1 DNA-repair protein XRCC1 isoform X1 [Telopea speciosissima]XP_043700515.1 DNA-repair protein XRCC1 isoform X2 [Telopea speciosissima]XP_043700516.1 DNA-repair protein XRCC1 isoform X1 [Telopea speciosissima]
MSDSKSSRNDGGNKTTGRNIPSWMASGGHGNKSHGKKPADVNIKGKDNDLKNSKETRCSDKSANGGEATSSTMNFSKLMEGVVFVLSGFVNPERSILRSQALEMGAEYQPDWNSSCTLLVCAFPNTPKFQQVEADCGTIVSKDWISECYNQKKLVAIERYLMYPGKPWRRNTACPGSGKDQEATLPRKTEKQVKKRSSPKQSASPKGKGGAPNSAQDRFSPSNLKKWATDDLNKTISWLESQEESPEPSEVKKIAAEGILTCLQDSIEALEQKKDIRQVTEDWKFVPHVVEELAGLESARSGSESLSKEDLYQQAMICKSIYMMAYDSLEAQPVQKSKKPKTGKDHKQDGDETENKVNHAAYDSDDTIEMTEEEIDIAYKTIASKLSKC